MSANTRSLKKKWKRDDNLKNMKNCDLKSRSESEKNCVQHWVVITSPLMNGMLLASNLGRERNRFQPIDEQQSSMLKILESYSKPSVRTEATPQRAVTNWLDGPSDKTTQRRGYVPPAEIRRDKISTRMQEAKGPQQPSPNLSVQEKSTFQEGLKPLSLLVCCRRTACLSQK